jgi:hypothetical protein
MFVHEFNNIIDEKQKPIIDEIAKLKQISVSLLEIRFFNAWRLFGEGFEEFRRLLLLFCFKESQLSSSCIK